MRFFSTFSGIGLFDLGLEWAGWECVGQCEIDEFCRRVLAKHWPNVWRCKDVREIGQFIREIRERCGRIDALVGGPPCQPSSVAGERRGVADDRWLWPEFLSLVPLFDPLYVCAENPPGVLSLDIDGVRFSEWIALQFANLGYTVFPILLGAEDIGAPHKRERVWFVACKDEARGVGQANPSGQRCRQERTTRTTRQGRSEAGRGGSQVAFTSKPRLPLTRQTGERQFQAQAVEAVQHRSQFAGRGRGVALGNSHLTRLEKYSRQSGNNGAQLSPFIRTSWPMGQGYEQHGWEEPRVISSESPLGIATYGSARRLARWRRASIKAIGNGVVPQCAEIIGRLILEFHHRQFD